MGRFRLTGLVAIATALTFVAPAAAQDAAATPEAEMMASGVPSITVSDQNVFNGRVRIDSAFSNGPGFVVIHVDNGGSPGPVAGFAQVNNGDNFNIDIAVDTSLITPTLFAMLHVDDGQAGVYEFDGSSGLDNPVAVDGQVVTPSFQIAGLAASDQLVTGDSVTIDAVTVSGPSWVVIHSDNNGAPGPVLGQTLVQAGTTQDVAVTLAADGRTNLLWPMLHVDDGTAGTYEFDGSSGLDNPVVMNGQVATNFFSTVPLMRASDQVLMFGDNSMTPQNMMVQMLRIDSVLCDSPCSVVAHMDADGAPGPVSGFTLLPAGLSTNVDIILSGGLTDVMWPMLHVDDGTVGTYEFDGSSGLDNPVVVNGEVVTFPVNVRPTLIAGDQDAADGMIRVDRATMEAPGWVVIHSSADGAPGPVLGTFPLRAGTTEDIVIAVDAAAAGTQVFPMLHYDTNEIGVYEFGTVEGADPPVVVSGNVVVFPIAIPG